MINAELKKYIEEKILPLYDKNENGHGIDHIRYVIDRSLKFASTVEDINLDMVYTIAAYHDIGHHIDAKNHEKVSSEMLIADSELRKFFSEEEISLMADAVYDHRSSMEGEPRSVYGKIVSSADRNTSVLAPLKRTYTYRILHSPNATFDEVVEESRRHLLDKFGRSGYATEKMYFEDLDYKKFLEDITLLAEDKSRFREEFIKANGLDNKLKFLFDETRRHNLDLSLDEILYKVYEAVKDEYNESFDIIRGLILEANGIDELEYYTKDVSKELIDYVSEFIFPQYDLNDGGHNIAHILEVIRRSFALNDTFKLGLNPNMIYVIAACHDWGKYEDHSIHEKIAAANFYNDENMCAFFTDEERLIIKKAIEDHRSSKEDEPRSTYGKLISSADRNTRIEIVFIRSFFVAKERNPEMGIEEYLDYTIKRLSKKYSEENPENMFYEDVTYSVFINDMRDLLKREEDFKKRYCDINGISSRNSTVGSEKGNLGYIKK